MSQKPDFEASADMRLIDLQRAALTANGERRRRGRPAAEKAPRSRAPAAPQRALLAVEATATPAAGVIPGAVVTLALSIANEGGSEARSVAAAVPLPAGAVYRPGSFVRDGRPEYDDVAEAFFGIGLPVGTIAPKSRATFVWKLGVRTGGAPLVIAPNVTADGATIAGAHAIRVMRRPGSASAAPVPALPQDESDLPFYELDAEEQIEHEAALASLGTAAPPPAREALVLLGTLERSTLAYFERAFTAEQSSILHHCLLSNALACSHDYTSGAEAAGIRTHLEAQSQILHRIALHERLGKREPIAEYAGVLLADLVQLEPAPLADGPALEPAPHRLTLSVEIEAPAQAVLSRLHGERDRWDFVRARQLALALQAQRACGEIASETRGETLETALRDYARALTDALQRLFVRIRLDRTTSPLLQRDATLDETAKTLLAALSAAFA